MNSGQGLNLPRAAVRYYAIREAGNPRLCQLSRPERSSAVSIPMAALANSAGAEGGRQPNNVARAMCRESAMERYAYCIKSKGEVGRPRLFTHPSAPR